MTLRTEYGVNMGRERSSMTEISGHQGKLVSGERNSNCQELTQPYNDSRRARDQKLPYLVELRRAHRQHHMAD